MCLLIRKNVLSFSNLKKKKLKVQTKKFPHSSDYSISQRVNIIASMLSWRKYQKKIVVVFVLVIFVVVIFVMVVFALVIFAMVIFVVVVYSVCFVIAIIIIIIIRQEVFIQNPGDGLNRLNPSKKCIYMYIYIKMTQPPC